MVTSSRPSCPAVHHVARLSSVSPVCPVSRISQISVSPGSNSSGSAVGLKEAQRKASPRRSLHHRRRVEVESDGSTEETDSSEN